MRYEALEPGDILILKSHSVLGWLIGNAFRRGTLLSWSDEPRERPSNHNGIFGLDRHGDPVVFEALGRGFVATPLESYIAAAKKGECEFKFVRIRGGLTAKEQHEVNTWCRDHIGTKYDYSSYFSHIWRSFLRLPEVWNSQKEACFYCTEAVKELYLYLRDVNVLGKDLPAPYTAEKRIHEGVFFLVASCSQFGGYGL